MVRVTETTAHTNSTGFTYREPLNSGADFDDVDYPLESAEVVDVAGVQRQADGQSGGCDQEIDRSLASGLASGTGDCGKDPSIGSGRIGVKREGLQGRLDSLQTVLPCSPLIWIASSVNARDQLGKRYRGDARLLWKSCFSWRVDQD
jgi:hypothetical protein